VQKATLDVAGATRLDQIRASMGEEATALESGSAAPPALEGSQASGAIEAGSPTVNTTKAQPAAEPVERTENA
jgi:hypothetical protein